MKVLLKTIYATYWYYVDDIVCLYLSVKSLKMIITLNTDASFSNKHNLGAYAFWIACNKGKFFRSGALKGSIYTPIHAEMKCIINALHFIFENNELRSVKKIIINTDCLFAIDAFRKPNAKWLSTKRENIVNESAIIKKRFNSLFNDYFAKKPKIKKVVIEYRHIKAHKHTNDARHYVNDMCDREAKSQMGVLLKEKVK